MISKYLKFSIIAFLCGVYLFGFEYWYLIGIGLGLVGIFKRGFLVVLIFFLMGWVRIYFAFPIIDEGSLHFYQSEEVVREFEGVIVENPDRRREKANYILEVEKIDGHNVSGRVLFSMDLYPEFNYGDRLLLKGRIVEPVEFEDFSYKKYLKLFNVHSVSYFPRVTKLAEGEGSILFSALFNLKDSFESQLNKIIPEPMASFEAGLLTGSRKGIPEDLLINFNLTGLTHIIAISGYNISLIIILISSLFKNVARNIKIPIIITLIILFTLFVGASAAVVRASIMGIIAVFALWFGRQSQIMNALLLSALIMTLINPFTLLYDVGFQLSFLATLGLIVSGNHLEKFFRFLPEVFGLREAFAMTFSAQVFALPVILINFKRFSLISPVANVFVVPFIPFAMLFGFIGVIASYFNLGLGFVLIFPAWLVLKYCVFITGLLANLPLASFEVPWFSLLHFFIYFILCFFLFVLIKKKIVNLSFQIR